MSTEIKIDSIKSQNRIEVTAAEGILFTSAALMYATASTFWFRNSTDSDYADANVRNLTVRGGAFDSPADMSFNTAATTRMFIESATGRVGFGTGTPSSARLNVIEDASTGRTIRLDGANATMEWYDSVEAASRAFVGFGDAGQILAGQLTNSFAIRSENAMHLGVSSSIALTVRESGYGPGTGYIGVGITAPTSIFHVGGEASPRIHITSNTGGTGRTWGLVSYTTGEFIITDATASMDRLTIDSAGRVELTAGGSAGILFTGDALMYSGANILRFRNAGDSAYIELDALKLTARGGIIDTGSAVALDLRTNNINAIYVDSSQNVGVGTTTISSSLHVKGDTFNSSASAFRVVNSIDSVMLFVRNDNRVGIVSSSPNSSLHVGGSISLFTRTVTGASNTAGASDHTILADATSGVMTLNLPTAVGIDGRIYIAKKIDAGANAVTVDPNGAETIDGAATKVLSNQYDFIAVQSDGTNWVTIAETGGGGGGTTVDPGTVEGRVAVWDNPNSKWIETDNLRVFPTTGSSSVVTLRYPGFEIQDGAGAKAVGLSKSGTDYTWFIGDSLSFTDGILSLVEGSSAGETIRLNSKASQNSYINNSGNFGVRTSSPNSRLHANGSVAYAFRSISGATTLNVNDHTVVCDASGGAFTVTLPTAAGITGRVQVVKKIDAVANTVTVDGNGAETIEGSTTLSLVNQWDFTVLQSDGTNWIKIGGNV